ncbi:hypothetical protein DNTS_028825 [Danionella cerebrum]|uniref:Armadillo like helical domain containing 1 n=1 Tax=Danionella cerebrum TaxID=2873325 RepID=A0A553RKS5_9TELE|nr:hypothetical protein DNTS_028825 [Danionella translucida]TRZ02785.1 hypothetical protein DNTS_028825 [Danionella translucida]TRZ02786.1 hypothetical protein DNTS_028825 [Danionella translucida]TRZ02787.1 hypothetical protein DNTS_028825 [Danionella translucida]
MGQTDIRNASVMFGSKEQVSINQAMCFLHEWDQASKPVRCRMLRDFLSKNTGKTCSELELEFAQVASLFLARLTAWLRLTYMFGTCLDLQLRAVGVFISANHQYMIEFVEVGGVLTLLEILGQEKLKEEDKNEALHLLRIISNMGQKYKELVCESYGVKAIAECLAKSESEGALETSAALLESLIHGNPKFQIQVYKGLVALLTCTSPRAQQLVLKILRGNQPLVKIANHTIVEPLLNLLRSAHLEVQYEATELITELMQSEVRLALLKGLIDFLKPKKEKSPDEVIDQETSMLTAVHPVLLQQAACAKTIRILAKRSETISKELLSLQVIHHLLYAIGSQEHADSQKQASLALEHFVHKYPVVKEQVRTALGTTLFESFVQNADVLHLCIDDVQAFMLRSNTVKVL